MTADPRLLSTERHAVSIDLGSFRTRLSDHVTRRSFLATVSASIAMSTVPLRRARAKPVLKNIVHVVTNEAQYKDALSVSARTRRAALVDIGAEWCAFCKTIDNEILPHPTVRHLMRQIALVKVDVTAMDSGNQALLRRLRADGPPTLFVVETATGREYPNTRSVGAFRAGDLIRRLQSFST